MVTSVLIFLFFLGLGNAETCGTYDTCSKISQFCCSDNVCRHTCYYCSYDSDCGTGEQCCNGDCRDSFDYCPLATPVLVGSVVGSIVFFIILVSLVACCCCATCPCYYRRSSGGAVIVAQPNPYHQVVSTSTVTNQQVVQPYPSYPTGYQAPPPYQQAPQQPPYPGYQPPAPYPPPQQPPKGAYPM